MNHTYKTAEWQVTRFRRRGVRMTTLKLRDGDGNIVRTYMGSAAFMVLGHLTCPIKRVMRWV